MFEFLQYDFMQRALIAGVITALISPLVGMFLVVKRYSLIVDTLAHVSLLGIALGLLANLNPYLASTGFTVLASLAIEKIKSTSKLYQEAVLAMFLSGSLALSVIIISANSNFNVSIFSLLFGSITTVNQVDLVTILALSILVILTIVLCYKKFFLIAFDEELALASGTNTKLYNYILIALSALTISLSIRIVGVLLIGALMVIPVITAIQLRKSFFKTILIAVFISEISVVSGLIFSYYQDWSSGGTIVLASIICFLLVYLYQKIHQVLISQKAD